MAEERQVINEAYAGDIIGVFDPGIFSIGDTVCEKGMKLKFEGIPTFAPEHFAVIEDQKKRLGTTKGFIAVKPNCSIQSYAPCLAAWKEFGPKEFDGNTDVSRRVRKALKNYIFKKTKNTRITKIHFRMDKEE